MLIPPDSYFGVSAYIDPGAGSLIIQMLIASFVGGLYLLKVYWAKVKGFFGRLFRKRND